MTNPPTAIEARQPEHTASTVLKAGLRLVSQHAVWGLMAAGLIIILAYLLALAYDDAQRQARSDIRNLNLTLEARLDAGLLQRLQGSMNSISARIADELFTAPAAEIDPRKMIALAKRFPEAGRFDGLDASGLRLFSSDGKTTMPSVDQLRYWASLGQQPFDANPQSSMVIDNDKSRDLLYAAVPVFDDQQQRIGWIATSLPLKSVLDLLEQVDVGAHGVITVRRTDQPAVILRNPPAANPFRQYEPDKIDSLLNQGADDGCVFMSSRVDKTERLYGFRRIGHFPLVIVTGLAPQDYLAEWWYTVLATIGLCLLLFALVISLSRRLQKTRLSENQAEQRLTFMAFHDTLTGLPNRRFLSQRFAQAISEGGEHFGLLYLDIDHFKTINDSLGHVVGDAVLRILAKRLLALQPDVDTVARLGGDEYLILVRSGTEASLSALLKNIFRQIHKPCVLENYRLSVAPSIGVALYPQHGRDFDSLLKAADIALHQAKAAGRNTWSFYDLGMGERGLRRLQIQVDLRQAHEQGQLRVYYQPQMNLRSGKVTGAEALLRWWHPYKGQISPAEFIPAAESSGLIIPISNWLLRQVCRQAVGWQHAGLGRLTVAVNCSAVQFRQGNLVQEVKEALLETGLDPSLLELELTESILIENTEHVIDTISRLKALGIQMSIDDFGTGYSSMAYLKRFVVDKLKIDQSFVRGILDNPQDTAIVRSVIGLAHSLNMKVVAEGVENSEVLAALIAHECDEVQGYYIARPMPAVQFEAFMAEHISTLAHGQEHCDIQRSMGVPYS